jgi:CheY-like chemotaxis protein
MDQKLLDGVTIVMVEGYGDMRSVLAQFLSEQGARVISCPNAVQAFEAVKQNRPDVVLSELNLQAEDGFQLLRRIRTLGIEADGERTGRRFQHDFPAKVRRCFQAQGGCDGHAKRREKSQKSSNPWDK